jgi:predicted TIM-barrel fold metal-dependent hydrolase
VRPDWVAKTREEAIEPDLPIIDAHHHLWEFPNNKYRVDDFLGDVGPALNLRATVFVECQTHYRTDGPEAFRTVGEIEFALSQARQAAAAGHRTRVAAAMVGNANMLLGAEVRPVLNALAAASDGRLRGIRNIAVWHPDPRVKASSATPPAGLMADSRFLEAFAQLAPLGLTFDAWAIHTQLGELAALAAAFPETRIVLNHSGGPLAIGPYRGHRDDVFREWRRGLVALARNRNVFIKLGAFGMALFGFDFHEMDHPPGSTQLATAIAPYVEAMVEAFGADRCMFESNYPVDKGNFGYVIMWNAFKRVTSGASASERAALFHDTAADFYRIGRGDTGVELKIMPRKRGRSARAGLPGVVIGMQAELRGVLP